MSEFFPDVLQFGNGLVANAAEAYPNFPLLIQAPSSVQDLQGTVSSPIVSGDGVRNQSSASDMIMRFTGPPTLDFLNGANVVSIADSVDGTQMIAFDDSSLPDMDAAPTYVTGSGSPGPTQSPASSIDPSVAWTNGSVINSIPFSNTFICWVCAYVPEGANYDLVKSIGFDIGGFINSSALDGSIGAFLGDRGGGWGGGVTQTISGGWKGNRSIHGLALTTTQFGRVASVYGVNGVSDVWGKRMWESQRFSQPETGTPLSTADADTWTGNTFKSVFMNLGEGAPAGAGLYHMGIYNYPDGTLTEGEVERVCRFMMRSGKIPYWWV